MLAQLVPTTQADVLLTNLTAFERVEEPSSCGTFPTWLSIRAAQPG